MSQPCKVTLAPEERLLGRLVCFVFWLYISRAAFEGRDWSLFFMPAPEMCYRHSEEVRTRRWEAMFLDVREI